MYINKGIVNYLKINTLYLHFERLQFTHGCNTFIHTNLQEQLNIERFQTVIFTYTKIITILILLDFNIKWLVLAVITMVYSNTGTIMNLNSFQWKPIDNAGFNINLKWIWLYYIRAVTLDYNNSRYLYLSISHWTKLMNIW